METKIETVSYSKLKKDECFVYENKVCFKLDDKAYGVLARLTYLGMIRRDQITFTKVDEDFSVVRWSQAT